MSMSKRSKRSNRSNRSNRMVGAMRKRPALFLRGALLGGAASLALPACGTQEVGPPEIAVATTLGGPEQGHLTIWWEPAAYTLEEADNAPVDPTVYRVFVDGKLLTYESVDLDNTTHPEPFALREPAGSGVGFLPGGRHHVAIVGSGAGAFAAGDPIVFEGDGDIPAGSYTTLYLYGDLDAIQGRWVSVPITLPPNTFHAAVTNMVRDGRSIEVASCPIGGDCAVLSAPLALGETFDLDLDVTAFSPARDQVGWRLVPTDALPAPPLIDMISGRLQEELQAGPSIASMIMIAAPVYMTAQGNALADSLSPVP
jgi:hypothetical protein